MPLFTIKDRKATKIQQKEFRDELELHKLIDQNLTELFGVRYIKDEHITDKHGRIETLGLDESNRPVVIEYKRVKEKGQLSQANRYLTWIKQNPDSFELLVRKNLGDGVGSIDFSNPRIICMAQEYSIDDKCLALTLGAELWKYRYYSNASLVITREEEPEQLIKGKGSKYSLEKVGREPKIPVKRREAKTVEQILSGASDDLKKLYYDYDSRIMDISAEIQKYTTAVEINYKTSVNFVYTQIQNSKNRMKLLLRAPGDRVNDPKGLTKKIPKTHGYGKITRILFVDPIEISENKYTLDDVMEIVWQAYNATQ